MKTFTVFSLKIDVARVKRTVEGDDNVSSLELTTFSKTKRSSTWLAAWKIR